MKLWRQYHLAPPVGFEPTTLRLTAACSTCWAKEAKAKGLTCAKPFDVGIDLSSRSVSRQVLSALVSLTSVFGMGTGGPSPLKTPTAFGTHQILQYSSLKVKAFLPRGRNFLPLLVHHQGLEPWTPWLRVRCSTNWASGVYFYIRINKFLILF